MVAAKLLDAARDVSLMATSRRTDLEQGPRGPFGEKPLFNHATRRNAYRALSKNLASPRAFLIGAFILCTYTITSSHRATGAEGLESLVPHGRSAFGIRDPIDLSSATTLVIYDYQGLDDEDADNLRFFLALGVSPDDGNRYIVVAKEQLAQQQEGEEGSTSLDDSLLGPEQIPLPPFESLPPNVEIILRPNTPCRSAWGVLGWLIESNSIDPHGYKNFILVDSSVRGPFLPSHWPPLVHWSAALLARLQGSVHMAGATMTTDATQPGPQAPPQAQPRPQPRIRSGVVAFDQAALVAIRKDPDVLKCRDTVEDALWYNEAGASAAVLHSGLNLDCLMLRFQNKDWLDKSSWGWKERNSEMDSGPFQVMFVPVRTRILSSSRAAAAAHQYSMWAIRALKAASSNAESEDGGKAAPGKVPASKKTTATDFATARMQLDAAATQAAAMAIQKQREEKAQHEQEAAEHANSDAFKFEGIGLDAEFDRRIGGAADGVLANADRFDDGVGGGGGDFTDDFEAGNATNEDNDEDDEEEAQLPPDMDLPPTLVDQEVDDYSGANDFGAAGGGGFAGGSDSLADDEDLEDDYVIDEKERNPFGVDDEDEEEEEGGEGQLQGARIGGEIARRRLDEDEPLAEEGRAPLLVPQNGSEGGDSEEVSFEESFQMEDLKDVRTTLGDRAELLIVGDAKEDFPGEPQDSPTLDETL